MIVAFTSNNAQAIYSKNLLTKYANFENDFTWNDVSGSGLAENNLAYRYNGAKCLFITNLDTAQEYRFNAGDERMAFTAEYTGSYKIAFSLLSLNNDSVTEFNLGLYKSVGGGGYTSFEDIACTAHTDTEGFVADKWNRFFADIDLDAGDKIDFDFNTDVTEVGAELCFGGFKVEYIDRGQYNPSIYSPVEPITIETTVTLDFPSISNNDTHKISATVTGAKIGDYVQIVPPVDIFTNKIGFYAGVETDDKVEVYLSNVTGGVYNPPSGDYKIFLTRR